MCIHPHRKVREYSVKVYENSMKNEYQNVEWIIPKTKKMFIKNPRRSISAAFRYFRNHPRLTLIGCYPILATTIHTVQKLNIATARKRVLYALNQSEELKAFSKKDKNELIEELLNPSSVGMNKGKNAQQKEVEEKLNNYMLVFV